MKNKKKVLIIEPHSDDGLISIGGFLEKNKSDYDYYFLLCLSSDVDLNHGHVDKKSREKEFIEYVNHYNGKWINGKYGNISFPLDEDGNLDNYPKKKLISGIENVIQNIKPDILFIQGPSFHQDHIAVFDATIAALRPTLEFYPKEIYIMENPTYVHSSGPNTDFKPNTYIELTEEEINSKIKLFSKIFKSQIRPTGNCLSKDGIKSWARYRGIEARVKYAEALKLFSKII
tara:strand:+ start:352 stop:1044 length:693 start_codon:yes stop_codon:yes gene_type:complete